MSDRYKVIFGGEVVQGCEVEEVKKQIASILKEDSDYVEKLFSGRANVLIEDPDLSKCREIVNVFISVGAVCYIEDPASEEDYVLEVITKESTDPNPKNGVKEFAGQEPDPGEVKEKGTGKISGVTTKIGKGISGSIEKIKIFWQEALDSIKLDYEDGGARELLTNRHFQSFLAVPLVLLVILIFNLTYNKEVMPLTDLNCNHVSNHIDFVDNGFTDAELQNMKQNPADFLDYLLVFPVEKLGYEFEKTVGTIAGDFIDEDLSKDKQKMVLSFLERLTLERQKLYEAGLISEKTRNKLNLVSKKLGI